MLHTVYWAAYEEFLEPILFQPMRLLALGVQAGRSMQVLTQYLPNTTVVGVDYNRQPPGFPDGAYFVQGRQEDPAVLARAVEIADGPFDVVIDDAAHLGPPAKATWEFLYRDHVKAGGYYIFEDYGTAPRMPTWSDYREGWVRPPDDGHRLPSFDFGMIGLVKQVIDELLTNGDPIQVDVRPGCVITHKRPEGYRLPS